MLRQCGPGWLVGRGWDIQNILGGAEVQLVIVPVPDEATGFIAAQTPTAVCSSAEREAQSLSMPLVQI